MLDLTKREEALPSAIMVDGKLYDIKTDYRLWIRFRQLIEEGGRLSDINYLFVDGDNLPRNLENAAKALFDFCYPKNELPRSTGEKQDIKLYDFALDADYIFSAFWQQYGIDLCKVEMHWHKFIALFNGLQETRFNEIMHARTWKRKGGGKLSDYDKYMQKQHKAWEIKEKLTDDEEQLVREFYRKNGIEL